MKLGISWNCYRGLGIEEQAQLITKNGFTNTFMGGLDPKMSEVMPVLKQYGICCENVHAPFSHINDIWCEGEGGDTMLDELFETVNRCNKFEIPVMVVHLSAGQAPRISDIGYERFASLMQYADKNGVIVAYENQRMLANIAFALEEFPKAKFCWDTGHEACFTNGRRYMPLFGDRLAALHIHDNDMIYNSDLHLIPYDGKMDFNMVAKEIAESGYDGSLMLELSRRTNNYYDELSPDEYYSRAATAANKLRLAISEYKTKI